MAPGKGEGEYDFAIRGDYEAAVKAVFDWLETRERRRCRPRRPVGRQPGRLLRAARCGVREARQGLHRARRPLQYGASLGHAAGTDPRTPSGCARNARPWKRRKRHATTLSLEGVAQNITCPLYIVTGKLDRVIPWQDAERLARDPGGEVVDRRGRQSRRQQPRLSLAAAKRRLACAAASALRRSNGSEFDNAKYMSASPSYMAIRRRVAALPRRWR